LLSEKSILEAQREKFEREKIGGRETQKKEKEIEMAMGMASKTAGDWAFRAFTTGLACGTLYFAYGFSVNVYRGISWHKAHKIEKAAPTKQAP